MALFENRWSSGPKQDITVKRVVEEIGSNYWLRCTLDPESFWYWDKNSDIWRPDGEAFLMAWVGENAPILTKSDFNELKFEIQKRCVIPHEKFRANDQYLQFGKNELNLKTLKDTQGVDLEHYIKTKLGTELDINAPPPYEFLKTLQNALPDPMELYTCLQAFSTILLIKTMRIEKAFFFLGSGGNGKSTVMKAVENIFESYISHVDLADLVNDGFAVSQLVDKLANVYADIQTLKFRDLKIFKTISSGDTISVNEKYKARRDESVKVVQFYSANKMPEIENANDGFYRRVVPIVFDQVIKKPDPYIDDKLNTEEERKRILALLIRIARTTKRHGFLFEKTKEEIINIINEKSEPLRQMIEDSDYIIKRPEYEINHTKLFAIYRSFCKENNFSPKPLAAFTRTMHDLGFESRKSNGERYFIGIGFPSKGTEGQEML